MMPPTPLDLIPEEEEEEQPPEEEPEEEDSKCEDKEKKCTKDSKDYPDCLKD